MMTIAPTQTEAVLPVLGLTLELQRCVWLTANRTGEVHGLPTLRGTLIAICPQKGIGILETFLGDHVLIHYEHFIVDKPARLPRKCGSAAESDSPQSIIDAYEL